MRILDLAEFYSERGGGVRSYLDRMALTLDKQGHEVIVVAPGSRDESVTVGSRSRVERYAAPPMPYDPTYFVPWRVDKALRLIKQAQPDVLQVSSPFVPAWVARWCRDVPLRTYVYHSDPIGCYVEPAARRLPNRALKQLFMNGAWSYMRGVCQSVDATVAAAPWLVDLLKQKGCQGVHCVPFGIEKEQFGPHRADVELRERLLGPLAKVSGAKLLLIAGRLAMDKRQALLMRAVAILAERRAIALVLLGDGPDRDELLAFGQTLPAFSYVPFTKNRGEYAAILATADALVHGSLGETYGFVLAETLASGTPLVLPQAAGAAAMGDPACAVHYSPSAGPRQIAAAINAVLAKPRAGEAAHFFSTGFSTVNRHFEALVEFYSDQLAKRRVPRAA